MLKKIEHCANLNSTTKNQGNCHTAKRSDSHTDQSNFSFVQFIRINKEMTFLSNKKNYYLNVACLTPHNV